MEKGNTKRKILEAALALFSIQGFEAISISQLADAFGIRKASLYSHFENKQTIYTSGSFSDSIR
ncbi:MAG: TetR/AcrR family transcriptional regulator [Candidatus Ornithomonoglobus sp.]